MTISLALRFSANALLRQAFPHHSTRATADFSLADNPDHYRVSMYPFKAYVHHLSSSVLDEVNSVPDTIKTSTHSRSSPVAVSYSAGSSPTAASNLANSPAAVPYSASSP